MTVVGNRGQELSLSTSHDIVLSIVFVGGSPSPGLMAALLMPFSLGIGSAQQTPVVEVLEYLS